MRGIVSGERMPPVAQGDIYRAVRRRPRAIGIIDGYFEGVPAVWHKEILWAMAQGIHEHMRGSGHYSAAVGRPFGNDPARQRALSPTLHAAAHLTALDPGFIAPIEVPLQVKRCFLDLRQNDREPGGIAVVGPAVVRPQPDAPQAAHAEPTIRLLKANADVPARS